MDEAPDEFSRRLATLESELGPSDGNVLHSPVPFEFGPELGGGADVVAFPKAAPPGLLFATCELLGRPDQRPNRIGTYELAICHRSDENWGPSLISRLAHYTLQSRLEAGETMDLGPSAPPGSRMRALLFQEFCRFMHGELHAGILLCIGITGDELNTCRRGGTDRVLSALKAKGVYPFTDIQRRSSISWF